MDSSTPIPTRETCSCSTSPAPRLTPGCCSWTSGFPADSIPSCVGRCASAIYALLQRDEGAFLDGMQRMGMIAPGAREGVARAVGEMFRGIAGRGGPLGVPAAQVLSLKDEAKTLLQQTPGLQLPNDLLLFAKTLSYVFALGDELDPEADLMQLSLPYLLQFLAGQAAPISRAPGARDADPAAG